MASVVQMIDDDERRARLGARHFLAKPAREVERVAGGLVGLHSSDPVTVFLSARARVTRFQVSELESALYERKSLMRMLGMRRTMFVVPVDLAATMDVACTQPLGAAERKRLTGMLEQQSIAQNAARWLARVEAKTLDALSDAGEATASELTAAVPELGRRLSFGEGKRWAGTMSLATRVLFLLASEGRVVRGRPLGTWVSSQYRWSPIEQWLVGGLPAVPAGEARADLVRRWLRTFGPGTLTDIKWWTGWTVARTRSALDDVGAVEVELTNGMGYVLPDDLEPVRPPGRWVALLPGLDPTVMGWKERDWYLGGKQAELFDRNGNAGPTVWADGRIVGGWAQRTDGTVAVELLETVDATTRGRIDAEADRVHRWLGATRITPRFPTPLEKRLR